MMHSKSSRIIKINTFYGIKFNGIESVKLVIPRSHKISQIHFNSFVAENCPLVWIIESMTPLTSSTRESN